MKRFKTLSFVLAILLVCASAFAIVSGAANDTDPVAPVSGEVVKYSDYGAVGDGVTDDYAAIKAAHDYANANGLPVEATPGATYYIGAIGLPSVIIQTNTDWKGAKFIVDDRAITSTSHPSASKHLFEIKPSLAALSISPSDIPPIAKGATSLGYAPGVDCLIHIENSNIRHYIREGLNANSGSAQQEILLVHADGTIDATTPPIWDYSTITSVWAVPVNETPITVGNATFETLANEINPDKYLSVSRGINVTRSNTTVSNVNHTVVQVKDYRAAYAGFFNAQRCNAVLFYNCEIYCHKDSYFLMPDGVTKNLLGSYELGANNANNIRYEKVIQTNFFDIEGEKVHNQGLMGTNYCKNMYVDDSMFARFDAHCQVYNLTVKDSDLQRVNTIGFGTVKIENTNFWGSFMVDLRTDYGGLFDGDYYLKNVTMKDKTASRISMFNNTWKNHDFGYTVVQPQNVYIENFKVEKNGTIYLYTSAYDSAPDLTADVVNGETNNNPIVPTKLVKVISNPAKTRVIINKSPTFKDTVLEMPEEEETINVYHVNVDFSDGVSVNGDGFVTGVSSTVNGFGSLKVYTSGNGHNNLNLKTVMNGTDRALLFSGSGNPNNVTNGTNICVDLKPSSDGNDVERAAYDVYKGKSFVASFDIKPLATDTNNVNAGKIAQLFTFCNKYCANGGGFVQNGLITMKLSDYSLYVNGASTAGYRDLNTKLEVGKFSTVAIHVNVPQNTFSLYVNDQKIASGLPFLNASEIANICTYDDDGSFVASTKSNKMEDFLPSYVRVARINGWEIEGDVYEFDNAKLYFSETYLGTGDLNAKPAAPANKYQVPNPSFVSSVISSNYGNLNHYVDKNGTFSGGTATKWEDGNNASGKTVITLGNGTTVTSGTFINNGVTYTSLQNKQNIFKDATDPVTNTPAVAIKPYNAPAYMANSRFFKNEQYWVTKSGTTYTVVPEGTPGAISAILTSIDEGNNGNLQRLGNAMDLVNNKAIVSVNFRWGGEVGVGRLIEPCNSTIGFNDKGRISILGDGTLVASNGSVTLAKLSTDRYYDVTAVYYALETGDDLYSMFYDVYLDGICVGKKLAISNLVNKTYNEITGNGTDLYGLRYFANCAVGANADVPSSDKEYLESLYVRSIYEYTVDVSYVYNNISNSGNTIEGFDLTLGSNLELNYYMNLLPETVADPDAKVVFTIGNKVVGEVKVSDVDAGANGLYKFTCPVNSTQMAKDVKVSIESTAKSYKIYMNGVATADYTYSVAKYAKTILDSSDDKYTAAKPVIKAMLNYGAAAQTYFAAKNGTAVGTLANAGYEYTAAELAAADFGAGTVIGATEGMTATLTLDTDTVIKIYKNGALVGTSEGISADKLDRNVSITCSGGETVSTSVLTIAGKVPAEKTEFRALAQALALYSAATEAYLAG